METQTEQENKDICEFCHSKHKVFFEETEQIYICEDCYNAIMEQQE